MTPDSVDASAVLVDGPWTHRVVSANGIGLHVAEAGTGPLVLLLHGFPEFWWTWRHQLVGLADAGFRVVAPDLRGYGASDKPPRGYDAVTLAADVAGLVRALGERDATIVGHDWGGLLAWTVGTLHPRVVRRLAVLGAAHPAPAARGPAHRPARPAPGQRLRVRVPDPALRRVAADPGRRRVRRPAAGALVRPDLAAHRRPLRGDPALPGGGPDPEDRALRAGVPPLDGPLAAAPGRLPVRALAVRAGLRAHAPAARSTRLVHVAAHRAGIRPVRRRRVRVAADRRRRPLPARGVARPGHRRTGALGDRTSPGSGAVRRSAPRRSRVLRSARRTPPRPRSARTR